MEDKTVKKNDSKVRKVVLPQTLAELQKMRVERLMKNMERPVVIPATEREKSLKPPPDFVREIMGSSAGAGSGEFHVYRGSRRREYNRQRLIEENAHKVDLDSEFQKLLETDQKVAEERSSKKRNKRLRKKQKQMEVKKKKQAHTSDTKGDENDRIIRDKNETSDSDNEEDTQENCFVIGGR